MKKTSNIYYILIAVAMSSVFLLSGCRSKKTIAASGSIKTKSHKEVVGDVIDTQLQYETLSAKGSTEFRMGKTGQKFPMVMKLIKDQAIQLSARMPIIGAEMIRVNITPDSILIIDRLNKNYVSEGYSQSQTLSSFDFNFYNLQDLLTNRLFVPGKPHVDKGDYGDFKISPSPDSYLLQTKGKGNVSYSFSVDGANRLLSTLIASEERGAKLEWDYQQFVKDNRYIYPTVIAVNIGVEKKNIDLNISLSNVEIDKGVELDNSIPSKYKKVTIRELLEPYIKIR